MWKNTYAQENEKKAHGADFQTVGTCFTCISMCGCECVLERERERERRTMSSKTGDL